MNTFNKKNFTSREPRRVLSVINLTAADYIKSSSPKDKISKFPVLKPKTTMRRKSDMIKRCLDQEQHSWFVHYREHVARQLKNFNRHEMANDLRNKKVTFNFCDFLKRKEAEQKDLSPAKYHD